MWGRRRKCVIFWQFVKAMEKWETDTPEHDNINVNAPAGYSFTGNRVSGHFGLITRTAETFCNKRVQERQLACVLPGSPSLRPLVFSPFPPLRRLPDSKIQMTEND